MATENSLTGKKHATLCYVWNGVQKGYKTAYRLLQVHFCALIPKQLSLF